MSVEIIRPNSDESEFRESITFEEIKALISPGEGSTFDMVELVTIVENGEETQCCCNEDGLSLALPINEHATKRFRNKINIGFAAVGVWVILKGDALLS